MLNRRQSRYTVPFCSPFPTFQIPFRLLSDGSAAASLRHPRTAKGFVKYQFPFHRTRKRVVELSMISVARTKENESMLREDTRVCVLRRTEREEEEGEWICAHDERV